jgi:DNA end-binding protein Ku
MVSIPVRLYKAARRERIRFRHVYRPAAAPAEREEEPEEEVQEREVPPPRGKVQEFPKRQTAPEPPVTETPEPESLAFVHNRAVGEVDDAPLERPQLLKGFEIEKGRYVALEPGEVAALRPQTSAELDIVEFVKLEEIDPIFFETSYYVHPEAGGEKPYALLYRALAESGYTALGSLAMHGREHATVIRPGRNGLILHTLYYANEVHAEQEYRIDPEMVASKELDLAKTLVRALAAHFEPEKLRDTFEERLREFIESRADTAVSAYRRGEVTAPKAPSVDIMEALKKSLEMARKPVKSEKTARAKQRKSRA